MLREIAFVRLLLPFCLGIAAFVFLPHPEKVWLLVAFALSVGLFLATHCVIVALKGFRHSWVSGVVIHLVLFFGGYLVCAQYTQIDSAQHFSNFSTTDSQLLLQVEEPPQESEKTFKTVCKVLAVKDSAGVRNTIGKVQIFLYKSSKAAALSYGDRMWVKNKFAELQPPKNPGEFNYMRFMGFRQVYHQAFLAGSDWALEPGRGGNPLIAFSLRLRARLLAVLRVHLEGEQEYAVASSLILGMREKMDDDLIKAYVGSGTLHVLCVSGLHVAIMFQLFAYAFFFLDRNRKTRILKALIIVLLIWLYAMLTGLSPSVLRSAVMFTFITLGTNLKRRANIYNILACSAFALLLYNPYYLMEIGFQLSYVAVAGIVMFYPKIYPLLYIPNKILNHGWQITAVSIAAQVAVFPLITLYFKQFPVYFLLANVPVILISTGILYMGVALCALFWFPGLNTLLAICIEWLLRAMNWIVLSIEALPYSVLQGISIDPVQMWLLYVCILTAAAFGYWRRNGFLLAALASFAVVLLLDNMDFHRQVLQRKLVVYSISRTTAIDFISGKDHLFLADSSLIADDKRMSYSIKNNWWNNGLSSTTLPINEGFSLPFVKREAAYIQFLENRIVLLDTVPAKKRPVEKLKVDYLILSKNVKVKMNDLVKIYNFRKVIFDSSNSKPRVKGWKAECERMELDCYDVQESGAYVEEFNSKPPLRMTEQDNEDRK